MLYCIKQAFRGGTMTDYTELNLKLKAIIEDIPYPISNLANASALLYDTLEGINWAGFYLMQNGRLVLGPFQGKPACIEIPLGKGVCGTAAERGETVVVENVHEFPGHIACDGASNAEIVVPITKDGSLFGVLDIDSPLFGRFSGEDKAGLEAFVKILEEYL